MAQEVLLSEVRRPSVEEVFTAMAPRLWRALLLYSGSPEIADDAVSEAFAQAIATASAINDVGAWVWTAAFKIAAGELRRRADRGKSPSIEIPIPESMDRSSLIDLMRALEHISDMQRRALILRHYMGYTNVEIARILGSTPSSIGVQLFRSTRKLRGLLKEES